MRFHHWTAAALACLALSTPAAAQSKDAFDAFEAINPDVLFKGLIREEDITLLFRHLRESMAAAARGETPPESDAVQRRSEEIGHEAFARGSVLMGVMLSAFEAAAKQALREGFGEARPRHVPAPVYPSPFPR